MIGTETTVGGREMILIHSCTLSQATHLSYACLFLELPQSGLARIFTLLHPPLRQLPCIVFPMFVEKKDLIGNAAPILTARRGRFKKKHRCRPTIDLLAHAP